jgi:hypothetical protein
MASRLLRCASGALALVGLLAGSGRAVPAADDLIVSITDLVAMPMTGTVDGTLQTNGLLARVNALREEPGGAPRWFAADLNGPLYIVDKATRRVTTYLDFNGRGSRAGLFHRFAFETGWANGLITVQFDPEYRRNGRFYTVHLEDPSIEASNLPDNSHVPGLDVRGYDTTAPVPTPEDIMREAVVIEWTDSNRANDRFEGTARELLRVQLNTRIHPLGDLAFNPAARRGDRDWRVMYIGCGDGGSGESRLAMRTNPQRLDTLVGKILRIVPDLTEHRDSSRVAENGRYRIPDDNPFVGTPGARAEIWAYGFRNPHRLHFAIDRADPRNNRLIVNSIGLRTWEAVYVVHRGANYGYSLREGNQLLLASNRTAPLPEDDRIDGIVPRYPVIQYGHVPEGGDAIGAGFLYQGKAAPALRGKYLYTDISTGRLWYSSYREMLAADDDAPATLAAMHRVRIRWKDGVYDSLFPIAEATYHERGGRAAHLPNRGFISGEGRADAQLAADAAGELYVLTKSDGMIRAVTGAASAGHP